MITTKDLVMRYEDGTSISYGDLVFETGKRYVLLGASGCGKSTLLNLIAGVLTPTEGSVMIDGQEMTALPRTKRDRFRIRSIGYIFQDFKLIEEMTVQDNLDLLKLERIDLSRTDEVLDRLGILALKRRRIRHLSGGEKQRVAIARALIKQPPLILADEPTGNLNYEIGRRVMEDMTALTGNRTLITVTHDERLSDLFDCVIRMDEVTGRGRSVGCLSSHGRTFGSSGSRHS